MTEPTDTEILEFLFNQFKSYCFDYDFKGGSYGYTNNKSKWVFMDKAFQQKENQTLKNVMITAMREENKIQEFKKQLEEEFNDRTRLQTNPKKPGHNFTT